MLASASVFFIQTTAAAPIPLQPKDGVIVTIPATAHPLIDWTEDGVAHSARWRSESGNPAPRRVVIADDRTTADAAYRLARAGTAMLWRGDFQNARQLLQALTRRVEGKPTPKTASAAPRSASIAPGEAFNLHRQAQARRAQTLAMLLLPLESDYSIPLRRAPDLRQACEEAYGPGDGSSAGPSVLALRELLGLISAHEWRKRGVEVPALGARIHPHYGVFAPIRGEYVGLVAEAPLPSQKKDAGFSRFARLVSAEAPTTPLPALELAFDIGTGTGVLAAVLARRGVARIVATDQDPRALACARENLARLGLSGQVEVIQADLFPAGCAPLVVCNPPWLPARPSSTIESAVYDPDSRMLLGFINGLAAHLTPGGEGWLVLSDLAEHLGLRSRAELLAAFDAAGLEVLGRDDVRPQHPRASDPADPLHAARAAERTSLWRLAARRPDPV
ncbi:MAG: methylase [Hydrogenophilales bacterium 28-61-23]|nr:MAG: methylase [Hydrogenophilales bacterium 28-61-23]